NGRRVVVVTAAAGIGLTIAKAFAANGDCGHICEGIRVAKFTAERLMPRHRGWREAVRCVGAGGWVQPIRGLSLGAGRCRSSGLDIWRTGQSERRVSWVS